MIRELLIYTLAPLAVLLTWTYQRLADRYRDRHHSAWSMPNHDWGSADVASVETHKPAVDSSDSESAAGRNVRVNSPRETAMARTDPAAEVPPELGRGPQQPVDVADPRHGVDWRTNPQLQDLAQLGDHLELGQDADAVGPETTASARSAA